MNICYLCNKKYSSKSVLKRHTLTKKHKKIHRLYNYYNNNKLSDAEEGRVLRELEELGVDVRHI